MLKAVIQEIFYHLVRDLWPVLYSEFFRQCSSETNLGVMGLPDITAEESNSSA
jgi:hypothetical protein